MSDADIYTTFYFTVKKETIAAVSYEINFLTCYRLYLKHLENVLHQWKENSSHLGLQVVFCLLIYLLKEMIIDFFKEKF